MVPDATTAPPIRVAVVSVMVIGLLPGIWCDGGGRRGRWYGLRLERDLARYVVKLAAAPAV